jgi:hypothetical protein
LPSHASDLLSARLQAIGGARTFTSQDSQPCQQLTNDSVFSSSSAMFPPLTSEGSKDSWRRKSRNTVSRMLLENEGHYRKGSARSSG